MNLKNLIFKDGIEKRAYMLTRVRTLEKEQIRKLQQQLEKEKGRISRKNQ